MIQLNLLPDVKVEFLKARRLKRLVSFISIVASGASLVLFVIAFVTVSILQKNHMESLTSQASSKSTQLKNIEGIDEILTVQNQLDTLLPLHDQKIVTSRLFNILSKITPKGLTISGLEFNFDSSSATINGDADNLDRINTFADMLKSATFVASADGQQPDEQQTEPEPQKAFSEIVLSSFGIGGSVGASYTITFNFDPQIFSNTNSDVKLSIGGSQTDNTDDIFKEQPLEQGD